MILERVGRNQHGTLWAVICEDTGDVLVNGLEYDDGGVLVGDAAGEVIDGCETPEQLLDFVDLA